MNLIIDIGNSSVKYYYAGLEFRSLAELELSINQGLENLKLTTKVNQNLKKKTGAGQNFSITVISSVPESNSQYLTQVEHWLAKQVKEENAACSKNYEIKIYNPLTDSSLSGLYPGIGADRVAKLDAAHRLFLDRDIVLFDFGTATTMSICNAAGEFLGGYITTGFELCLKALGDCAELPDLSTTLNSMLSYDADQEPAKSTHEAILTGSVLAHRGLIDAWLDAANKISSNPVNIATGGAAEIFVDKFDRYIPAAELLTEG